MVGGSATAHTRGQMLRELMGRANYMSRDLRLAKYANQREQGRLRETIEGKHGINSQYLFTVDRVKQEAKAVRLELAETNYRRKCINPREASRKFESKDALKLTAIDLEEKKRRRNARLMEQMKKRTIRADIRVKDFIEKMDEEIKLERKVSNVDILKIIFEEEISLLSSPNSIPKEEEEEEEEEDDRNPENLAPDGKIRTKFKLPPIEESWANARRTRYVRTKKFRDFERELNLREIFSHRRSLPPINS